LIRAFQVDLYLRGILVNVNLEITELASLPAERYMEIGAERLVNSRRTLQALNNRRDVLRLPL
jgi:hypothetical protein